MRRALANRDVTDPSHRQKIKVVYVLGSSRSGSTALDSVLGASPGALSTGELGHLHWALQEGNLPGYVGSSIAFCSCGQLVEQCPLWSTVVAQWGPGRELEAFGRATDRYETPGRSLPLLILGRLFGTRAFRRHLALLGRSVELVAGASGVTTLIDSTKGAGRGWLYSLLPPSEFDVRFVHLVRDGRSVVSSMMQHYEPHKSDSGPSPWPRLAAAAFSTAHWVYMNLASSSLGLFHRSRYRRIQFEDLLNDPDGTLRELEPFLGIDLRDVRRRILAGEPLPTGHLLCGNRAKGSPLRLLPPKSRGADELALGPSLVFLWLAGWLQWIYGGPGSPSARPRPGL